MIGPVGSVIAGLLPALFARTIGAGPRDVGAYRLALAVSVGLAALALLPVLRPFPAPVHAPRAANDLAPQHTLPFRTLLRFAWASLLFGVAGGSIMPFQNLFFRMQFGLSDATVGVVLAGSALGLGVGGLLGMPISRRMRAATRRGLAALRGCAGDAVAAAAGGAAGRGRLLLTGAVRRRELPA